MANLFYRDVKYLFEVGHHGVDVRDVGRLPGGKRRRSLGTLLR